jgi:hypothetical protein
MLQISSNCCNPTIRSSPSFEIRKKSALEDVEEPKVRTMAVAKLTPWLELIEAGIKMFEDKILVLED